MSSSTFKNEVCKKELNETAENDHEMKEYTVCCV